MKTNRRSFLAMLGLAPIAAKSIDLQPKAVALPKALPLPALKTVGLQSPKVYDAQYIETRLSRKISITLDVYGHSKLNLGEFLGPLGSLFTGEEMCKIFSFSNHLFWFQDDQRCVERWVLISKERNATPTSDRITFKFASFKTDITGFL